MGVLEIDVLWSSFCLFRLLRKLKHYEAFRDSFSTNTEILFTFCNYNFLRI